MGATIPPSDAPVRPARPTRLARFDGCERLLHWANAILFLVLLATAAILYVGSLSAIVGRRELVRQVHVISGVLLPVPLLLALAGPWRRGLRADIRAFNRFDADDRRWLRSRGRVFRCDRAARARVFRSDRAAPARDPEVRLGKFNPGQKLNAAFVAGSIAVMLVTGAIMTWFDHFPVDWRTGATFVHDWTAFAVFAVVLGHIWMALSDGDALNAMVKGWVPAEWARQERPRWYEEVTGLPAPADPGPSGPVRAGDPGPSGPVRAGDPGPSGPVRAGDTDPGRRVTPDKGI